MLLAVLAALLGVLPAMPATAGGDLDGDGIADALEQDLLARFRPDFLLSGGECDGQPAEFMPGLDTPRVAAKNGTIYGQAFPLRRASQSGAVIELHYYHLWGRDCRPVAHDLDVEHVSALVRADSPGEPASAWRALYWYAAAHEGTVCDATHGARAGSLGATDRGPVVWVSAGKHASFLTPELCRWGCGGDVCADPRPLPRGPLLNLGERTAPLAGARWVASPAWPLAAKMGSDFPETTLARLDKAAADEVVTLHGSLPPVKAVVLAAGSTANGLETGRRHSGGALDTARTRSGSALQRAWRSVQRFLGGPTAGSGSR